MAKVIITSAANRRLGIHDDYDQYEIVDDDAETSGPGYRSSHIIHIQGFTAAELRAEQAKNLVKVEYDEYGVEKYWQDPEDSKWYEIKKKSKYKFNWANVTEQDKTDLASALTLGPAKTAIIAKAKDKISTFAENKETLKP